MKMLTLAFCALAWMPGGGAQASDIIEIDKPPAPAAAPVMTEQSKQRQADGDWARRVIARAQEDPAEKKAPAACKRNPDRSPQGEVWAGIGTDGYRTVGTVVTTPVGDCGELTIGVSETRNDQRRGGGRRR